MCKNIKFYKLKGKNMWAIIGYIDHGEEEERVVALFSSKKEAEKYLSKATLKRPWHNYPFKSKSLLSHFNEARIDKAGNWEKIMFFVNPPIDF